MYTYRVRRKLARPAEPTPAPANAVEQPAEATTPDLTERTKAELVELAEAQGVDSSGTKAEIIERLDG